MSEFFKKQGFRFLAHARSVASINCTVNTGPQCRAASFLGIESSLGPMVNAINGSLGALTLMYVQSSPVMYLTGLMAPTMV